MAKMHLLTDAQVRSPKDKTGKPFPKAPDKAAYLNDGRGLMLHLTKAGTKIWLMRYRFGGKPCMASLGSYPTVSLGEAREAAAEWHRKVHAGINPAHERRAAVAAPTAAEANTFRAVALELMARDTKHSEKYIYERARVMGKDVFPMLGARDVGAVMPVDVIKVVEVVQLGRGKHEQARKTRGYISRVLDYAMECGRVPLRENPANVVTRTIQRNKREAGVKTTHQPAMPWSEMPAFLRKLDGYCNRPNANRKTELAMKLLILTLMRPGSVGDARWSEFHDLAGPCPMWVRCKMKNGDAFAVPLSRQALAVLDDLAPLTRSKGHDLLFPNARYSGGLSENTLCKALRSLGYSKSDPIHAVAHGFRTTGRTYMDDRGIDHRVGEWCLAHGVSGLVGSYSRGTRLSQRRAIMQWYADTLDAVKAAGTTDGVRFPLPSMDVEPEAFDERLLKVGEAVE